MPEKFVVTIPVKPYVKRFIEQNYGLPADFSKDPDAHKFFIDLLRKPNTSRDRKYPEQLCTYTETLEVLISQHDFYKYGWELTRTDIVTFGKRFEERSKSMMRSFVGVYVALGLPPYKSINKFQQRFNFDETYWPYESIKKDFYRNGGAEKIDFEGEIYCKVEKIILRTLYDSGTISKLAKTQYETAEQTI
jgi:hypothetical protein